MSSNIVARPLQPFIVFDAVTRPDVTVASTIDKLMTERIDRLMRSLADTRGSLPADTIAELARLLGAVSSLREIHSTDARGRCRACRTAILPASRRPCTVYETLDYFLGATNSAP